MGRRRNIITDLSKFDKRFDEAILQDEKELNKIVSSIKSILKSEDNLYALAAPQIGFNSRIFCIKFSDGDIRTFINPMITKTTGGHLSRETCSSIPDKEFIVIRFNDIEATYQLEDGTTQSNLFQGVSSEVFQQMVHLLDGILISDFGLELIEGWDNEPQEVKNEIINMYLDFIKKTYTDLSEEIKNTPELKKIDDAIEFMTGVATGKITVEQKEQKLNRAQRRALSRIKLKN